MLEVFPFARSVRPRCSEWPTFSTRKGKLSGGFTERSPEYGGDFLLRAVFSLEFPQRSTNKSVADFFDFVEDHHGAADPWLLSFYTDRYREVRTLNIGTGDGAATDFSIPRKHLNASTLVVRKAGIVQVAGYTLEDNGTAPLVRFAVAPAAAAAIEVDVDFYVPVHFESDSLEAILRAAIPTDAKRSVRIDGVQVEEAQPGERIAR